VSRSNFGTINLNTWQASGLPRAELEDEVEGVLDGARIGVLSFALGKACMAMH
jgi:hypothetical protein